MSAYPNLGIPKYQYMAKQADKGSDFSFSSHRFHLSEDLLSSEAKHMGGCQN